MNEQLRKTFLDRVKPGRPHSDNVFKTMDEIAAVSGMLTSQSQKFEGDRNLTTVGRQTALAGLVKERLSREYARVSRPVRVGLKGVAAQREGLSLPKVDRTDTVGELRRQELRAYLRSLPTSERFKRAEELAADPNHAVALFDAPAFVSGMDDESLKMPKANVYDRLQTKVVRSLHGERLTALDEMESDLHEAEAMARVVRSELQKVSGLSIEGFEELMRPMEDNADKG